MARRPGYGLSSRAASTHASVADDAAAALDLLGIGEVAALGMSVGGAYAAAFAAQHADRTSALGSVATVPMDGTAAESIEESMELARPEFEAWAARVDVAASAREALADHHGFLRDAALCTSPGRSTSRASVIVRPGATHLATLAEHWPVTLATLR
ncbi:MAG: alpha/beta fold hydrolase [Nocardioides sp.]|uniref:alpha/beta fold hydrolase n=1 Tax=Nocardioides sp. TaxID=35761 RepID=UPI0032648B23